MRVVWLDDDRRLCIYCGALVTGEPLQPLRVMEAEDGCGACDLRARQSLFCDSFWGWANPTADLVGMWRFQTEDMEVNW